MAKTKLFITERALGDISDIEAYSFNEWGRRTASKYIADMEAALVRIEKEPDLLRPEEGLHPNLCFYRVNRHCLVFDRQPKAIVLLTVIHASRDIPNRLAEMQPTLAAEIELLHAQIKSGKNRRK